MQKIGRKLFKDRDEILGFCKKFQGIYLYGAGACAARFCSFFEEEGICIDGIIVSDGCRKETFFLDKYQVYELSEIQLSNKDGIIVALSRPFQDEVVHTLLEQGIQWNTIYMQQSFHYNLRLYSKIPTIRTIGRKSGEYSYFNSYRELDEIGCDKGTDKCSLMHNYLKKYEFFLKNWKDSAKTVLELGVFKGASTQMWSQYFTNATVYGVDINPECMQYEEENIKILIKDLGDEENLQEIAKLRPQIIVDDASHWWSHQIKALYHLLPALESGGVYILEDLGTSFYSYRNVGYDDACISAYDFLSAIAEVVCSEEPLRKNMANANIYSFVEEIEELASQIEMITFIHGSCIMIKK